jgi:hypothetical protein
MTIDEARKALTRAREDLGGEAPLRMTDENPVVSLQSVGGAVHICYLEPPAYSPGGFHLNGDYRLDTNRRVPRRLAHIEDAAEWLADYTHDVSCGQLEPGELADERAEVEALRPYWGPGVTKEQAVAAYLKRAAAAWAAANP